jgi:hypothetical protein
MSSSGWLWPLGSEQPSRPVRPALGSVIKEPSSA